MNVEKIRALADYIADPSRSGEFDVGNWSLCIAAKAKT